MLFFYGWISLNRISSGMQSRPSDNAKRPEDNQSWAKMVKRSAHGSFLLLYDLLRVQLSAAQGKDAPDKPFKCAGRQPTITVLYHVWNRPAETLSLARDVERSAFRQEPTCPILTSFAHPGTEKQALSSEKQHWRNNVADHQD